MIKVNYESQLAPKHRQNVYKYMSTLTTFDTGCIYLQGGTLQVRKYTDTEEAFRQESFFFYLTGCQDPGYHLVIKPTGESVLLVPPEIHDKDEIMWNGRGPELSELKTLYAVDDIKYSTELSNVLVSPIHVLPDQNLGSLQVSTDLKLEPSFLMESIVECRLIKSQAEIQIMQRSVDITREAHIALMKAATPASSVNEATLHSLFVYECSKRGGTFQAYTPIVASDRHAAVLHYNKNNSPLSDDPTDLLLVDAGCEYMCYASDITRTFPIGGKFSPHARTIYDIVLKAQLKTIDMIKSGAEYESLHREAMRVIGAGLLECGILKDGTEEQVVSSGAVAVFFPHGLGHSIGIDVHDCGGYPKGVERIQEPGLRYLRMRRQLKTGMVITIEPGCYFVKALLDDAKQDPQVSKYINWPKVAEYMGVGGVRIEDDIVVKDDGCEILSQFIPKEVEEIEALMFNASKLRSPTVSASPN